MADEIDMANEWMEMDLAALISSRKVYHGESAKECSECGATIPAARRRAVPGCRHCVDCAEFMELAIRA